MFKILVVEDDREMNRTVCAFLNQSGYEATGCIAANEAYDAMYETVFVGIVMVSAAYPLYSYVTKKEREKIAPEIIRLTDELIK